MNMKKQMTCIVCPMGCQLEVTYGINTLGTPCDIAVTGNTCKRGATYATEELVSPRRTLTTTVRTDVEGRELLSVKSSAPIPKDKLFYAMELANAAVAHLPVHAGDAIIEDFVVPGVALIACRDME